MNDSATRTRPTGLWVVAILLMCLGGLGSCGGSFSMLGILMQDAVAEMQENMTQPGQTPEMQELQRELQHRTQEVARQWKWPNLAAQVMNVLASLMLLVGGILLFRWHPSAPMIVIGAVVFSILVDLAISGLGIAVQMQTMAVVEDYMSQLGAMADPATERMMGGVMQASGSLGLCVAVGWLVAKLGAYIGSIVYLRKETVRQLFA